jgi:SAM-dependent methyltransferase
MIGPSESFHVLLNRPFVGSHSCQFTTRSLRKPHRFLIWTGLALVELARVTSSHDRSVLERALGRGHYPHQLSWLIDNPFRRLILSPETLVGRLRLSSASRVLELGAGSGYFTAVLARQVPDGQVDVVDLQPEMLAKARRKLDGQGVNNVVYSQADAGARLGFPDGVFDVALLVAVLGEVSNQAGCLRDLHRVLRIGGLLAIHEHIPDPDRITFRHLKPLVEAHGFVLEQCLGPSWNYTATFVRDS